MEKQSSVLYEQKGCNEKKGEKAMNAGHSVVYKEKLTMRSRERQKLY